MLSLGSVRDYNLGRMNPSDDGHSIMDGPNARIIPGTRVNWPRIALNWISLVEWIGIIWNAWRSDSARVTVNQRGPLMSTSLLPD